LTHLECNPQMLGKISNRGGLHFNEWKVQMGLPQGDLLTLQESFQAAQSKDSRRVLLTCFFTNETKLGKEVSRSKEKGNDMEEKQEAKKVRRKFTPEQKFEILQDIERGRTIKEGLAKHRVSDSLYRKWKRQLEVGVRASLRNGRPLKPADLKRLEAENRKLKEVVLNQALLISELKKEMNLD
jgi:transposase-like protein